MKVIFLIILIKKTEHFQNIHSGRLFVFLSPRPSASNISSWPSTHKFFFFKNCSFFSFLYPQWNSDLINEQCCGSSARPCHETQGHLTQHCGDLRWKNYNHCLVDVPFSQLGHATNGKPHINTTTTLKATESGSLKTSPTKSRDLLKL